MIVPCPTCGQPAAFEPDNRWRPFCSQTCRGRDLGAWASESFRVADREITRSDGSVQDPTTGRPLDSTS